MKRRFLLTSFALMGLTHVCFGSNTPTLSRVYSTPFTSQVQQYNDAGAQGRLDSNFGTSGSLSIDTQLSGGQAQAVQVLSDGTFLVVLSKEGANSVIAKYNSQGAVATSSVYGTNGIVDLGSTTLAAQAMMIDTQGRALVAGGASSGTDGWLQRVSADGDTVTLFATGSDWQFIAGLAQQRSGKIIAAGFNGTNAQIARYTLNGALDTTFGSSGLIVFDGASGRPSSTNGLYNVVVDGDDNICVLYLDGTTAKVTKFGTNGVITDTYTISYLANAIASTMRTGIALTGELIVGAQISSTTLVRVASMSLTGATPGALANFETPASTLNILSAIIPTSDGKVLLIGSDTASAYNMAVMRLTSNGLLDSSTTFNNTPFNGSTGYNLFNISAPDTSSVLTAASVAPDGQLYAVGYQIDNGITTPYVSRLFDAPYVSAIASFPTAQEQGILDTTFGTNATQSFRGVSMPYNGIFGTSLQQQTRGIVERSTGNYVLGSDGNVSGSADKTMMLTWLTSTGALDTNFGSGTGIVTLPNDSASNETMAALAVGDSNLIYVVGTNATSLPFIRSYSAVGDAISSIDDTGTEAVGIAIQGSTGILLFAKDSAGQGHISRYTNSSGTLALDTAGFGSSGKIATGGLG